MNKITSIDELNESILLLEIKLAVDSTLLKEQFKSAYSSLKPINIIKNTIKDVISAPDLKSTAVNAAIGFTTGFIAKKIFIGMSHSPLTKLIGFIIEAAVAAKAAKNADGIKSFGKIVLSKIANHNSKEI